VSPLTTAEVSEPETVVLWPEDEVTVYEVIGLPPSEDGAVQLSVAWPSPGTAFTPVGAPATVVPGSGTTGPEAEEAGPSPMPFVATTVKV
jgi:hypothetical protein